MAIDLSKISLKTWININSAALNSNVSSMRRILSRKAKLWAVVKSNAYGHGLTDFSLAASKLGVDGFCVDSVIEAEKLREAGIKKHIFVLGPTLPNLFSSAFRNDVAITISSFEFLKQLVLSKIRPQFHIKIDTGMHRQGFFLDDLAAVIKIIKANNLGDYLKGIYTHFASAKDINYPTYTEYQFDKFEKSIKIFENSGFHNLIKHCAATGATLLNKRYHLDAVRIGIGLYGLWPSKELEIQMADRIKFMPVLSWHSIITEIKNIKKGSYVGYDLIEKTNRDAKIAVVPIGYWHGYDRGLSACGEVLVNVMRARILGRVSMDLLVIDVTGIKCEVGDKITLIGRNGKDEIAAAEIAQKIGTTYYEVLTRLNPLIRRQVA